jgi:hypothetical protein
VPSASICCHRPRRNLACVSSKALARDRSFPKKHWDPILYPQWASVVCFRINSFASVFTPGRGVTLCGHSPKILAGAVASSARKAKQKRTEHVSSFRVSSGSPPSTRSFVCGCRLCGPPEHCQHLWPNRGTLQLAIVTNIIPKGQGVARILKVGRIRPPDWTDDYFTRRPKPCINESLSSDIWIRFLPLGSRYVYCSVRALS